MYQIFDTYWNVYDFFFSDITGSITNGITNSLFTSIGILGGTSNLQDLVGCIVSTVTGLLECLAPAQFLKYIPVLGNSLSEFIYWIAGYLNELPFGYYLSFALTGSELSGNLKEVNICNQF